MIIDAAWLDPKGKSYFTHNAKYYSDKDSKECSLPGMFTGLGFSSIDAALIGAGTRKGKIYFFSGELYTRFDFNTGKCEAGYPSSIKGVWNIPFSKIDAAWSHPTIKNKYYMSSGSEYIRLTVDKGGFDSGYPKPISQHWHGIEFSHIDAVIQGIGNRSGKLYFFSGTQYVRYDMQSDKVDRGYPNDIMENWGVPDSWKAETRHVAIRLLDIVCKETEDIGFFGAASEDEPTVMWAGLFGNKIITGEWRIKGIDDGDKKIFPINKQKIFEGELFENSPVQLIISLIERDHGGGSNEYKEGMKKTIGVIKEAGSVVSEFNSTAGAVIIKIADAANKVGLDGIAENLARRIDGDDLIGEEMIDNTVMTLPRGKKDHILRFNSDGGDYKIRYQTVVD